MSGDALTAADLRDLARIGSGPDDTAYYADWPDADWDNLKRLERLGFAATVNQSDWWRTAAGNRAATPDARPGEPAASPDGRGAEGGGVNGEG